MSITISPSILNCDIANLQSELKKIRNADFAHVDVMDNHFVPNLSWGLPVVEAVVKSNIIPVDAHLMIEDADRWAIEYAKVGCSSVTFHAEACVAPIRLARQIRKEGVKVGMALRPATPVEPFIDILPEIDMLLVMTVEPGFGGQSFLKSMMNKVNTVRKFINETNLDLLVQVDGGINRQTIITAAEAGANVFVAGSAVYKAEDAYNEVEMLRKIANKHSCCK